MMGAKIATTLANTGRPHGPGISSVNPPLVRASTFVFDNLADFEMAAKTPFDVPFYGRVGTPTTFAFEEAMAEIEGGHRAIATAPFLRADADPHGDRDHLLRPRNRR